MGRRVDEDGRLGPVGRMCARNRVLCGAYGGAAARS